jgi:hypothetical protein
MNTIKLKAKIEENKELFKSINKVSYYTLDNFINDAQCYVKAIKEHRMICVIDSVSNSGMSRNIHFHSSEKNRTKKDYYTRQYFAFFKAMGYTPTNSRSDAFRISGCGMDMIFHTNYTIIQRLTRLGMLNKKQCATLAQQTPTVL